MENKEKTSLIPYVLYWQCRDLKTHTVKVLNVNGGQTTSMLLNLFQSICNL